MDNEDRAISAAKRVLSRMNKASTPAYNPMGLSIGRGKKRKAKSTFSIDYIIFHFPGDKPLKKEYKMDKLEIALEFTLTLTEESTEAFVRTEIFHLLSAEYPGAVETFFQGALTYYIKLARKKELKKFMYGTLHKFDGVGLKSMITRDNKKVYVILNKHIPGLGSKAPPQQQNVTDSREIDLEVSAFGISRVTPSEDSQLNESTDLFPLVS